MSTLNERHQRARARFELLDQRVKTRDRKLRTRSLILWGTVVVEMMEKDEEFARSMRQRAARKFSRKIDREALGLTMAGETGS